MRARRVSQVSNAKHILYKRARRANKYALGLCTECEERAAPHLRCPRHRVARAEQQREHNDRRRALGLCSECLALAEPYARCFRHRLTKARRQGEYRIRNAFIG